MRKIMEYVLYNCRGINPKTKFLTQKLIKLSKYRFRTAQVLSTYTYHIHHSNGNFILFQFHVFKKLENFQSFHTRLWFFLLNYNSTDLSEFVGDFFANFKKFLVIYRLGFLKLMVDFWITRVGVVDILKESAVLLF